MFGHVVSWFGGTCDLLCAAFTLGALPALAAKRARLCGVLTLGALLSKETGALVPVVLLLYLLAFERPLDVRTVGRRLWPAAVAAALVLGLRAVQLAVAGGIDGAGLPGRSVAFEARAPGSRGPGGGGAVRSGQRRRGSGDSG